MIASRKSGKLGGLSDKASDPFVQKYFEQGFMAGAVKG